MYYVDQRATSASMGGHGDCDLGLVALFLELADKIHHYDSPTHEERISSVYHHPKPNCTLKTKTIPRISSQASTKQG